MTTNVEASDKQEQLPCDLLFVGARVIDPDTATDAVRNVGIRDGKIVFLEAPHMGKPSAHKILDVTGLVLTPGFIDLHSHAQTVNGLRLQALDGVTTALDLEAGGLPIPETYMSAQAQGRPINFGYAANWILARLAGLDGVKLLDDDGNIAISGLGAAESQKQAQMWKAPADDAGAEKVLELLEEGVRAGGIGVGVLAGYAPGAGRVEMLRLAEQAARLNAPLFVHGRYFGKKDPESGVEGLLELIGLAASTGAPIHLCHINSSYALSGGKVLRAIQNAQKQGVRITTEAYPYHASSTSIGAVFLSPEGLAKRDLTPQKVRYLPTGERVASAERLQELREKDPSGLCVIDILDENNPEESQLLFNCIALPGTAIASDAIPVQIEGRTTGADLETQWPLPVEAFAHPRSAGCFARALGYMSREQGVLGLAEMVKRCTLIPAQILEPSVPSMKKKGRIQQGTDADITIFDPETIGDRATFERVQPSQGVIHVLVNGEFVVEDGELHTAAMPGKPIRSEVAPAGVPSGPEA